MVWHSTWPLGTDSVRANTIPGQDNTNYIKSTMNLDHFWDSGTNKDGHHQFTQMPQSGTASVPTNPALATGCDGVYYCKAKSAVESPSNQDVQPFFQDVKSLNLPDLTPQFMQLLGIRVMAMFHLVGIGVVIDYQHNLTSIVRNGVGTFTATFPTLPSSNYLVLGGMIRNGAIGDIGTFNVRGATSATSPATKTTTTLQFITETISGSPEATDPLQCWFVIFGG